MNNSAYRVTMGCSTTFLAGIAVATLQAAQKTRRIARREIDAVAGAIGSQKAVVLEPDAVADLPSDCGYNPTQVNIPQPSLCI